MFLNANVVWHGQNEKTKKLVEDSESSKTKAEQEKTDTDKKLAEIENFIKEAQSHAEKSPRLAELKKSAIETKGFVDEYKRLKNETINNMFTTKKLYKIITYKCALT